MRVDAHQHFWHLARGDYGWLTPDLGVLYRDFEPRHLQPLLDAAGVDRSVVVQAAPTEAETRHLLDLCAEHPRIAAVVGWADLEAADAPARIATLAAEPGLVGLRPMIQDIADDDWMLGRGLTPAFEAMTEHGLRLDALVHERHLPRLATLLDRHPALPVVIDHGAKPDIAGGRLAPWREALAPLAARENVYCKLSGLLTEAGDDQAPEAVLPWMDALLELFGPERLMWGSDWPVLTLAGEYGAWHEVTLRWLDAADTDARERILGGTAVAFYGLTEGNP
jgi:L-fuconolactonase